MTPAEYYPNLRLPPDATWEQCAHVLQRWLQHARMGHPCPNPEGWQWSGRDGASPSLVTHWGEHVTDRGQNDDPTYEGCTVEPDGNGRWRWVCWSHLTISVSGLPGHVGALTGDRRQLEQRAATWPDCRDALADAERWLDVHHPEWRGGITYRRVESQHGYPMPIHPDEFGGEDFPSGFSMAAPNG